MKRSSAVLIAFVLAIVTATLSACAGANATGRAYSGAPAESLYSRCTVPVEHDGEITLILEEIEWEEWEEQCLALTGILRPGPPPYDGVAAVRIERLLEETGYFETAICELPQPDLMECNLTPRRLIREISIEGRLPVGLLREEIRRRLFVEPGSLIIDEPAMLSTQRERLLLFLERKGYFESSVDLSAVAVGSAEPNLGVELVVFIEAGRRARLRNVRVTGRHPLEPGEVESRLRRFGLLWFFERRFRPDRFQDDLDELTFELQEQGWPEARVTGRWFLDPEEDFIDVTVHMDAGPALILLFEGNQTLSDSALARLATFSDAGVIDPTEVANTADAVRLAYQEAGHPDVRIESETRQPDDFSIEVFYRIEEGPRARVREVDFEGNVAIASREIRREADLQTRPSRFLSPGRYVDESVEADIASIEALYEERGFAAATARARRIDRPDDDIEVVFLIEEGPVRVVAEMEIRGLPEAIDEEELRDRLLLRQDEPFVEEYASRDQNEILATLASAGYPMADMSVVIDAPSPRDGGEVSIRYIVAPGTRAVVGGFLIRGNFRTRTSLIKQQLRLSPGDPLDLEELGEARRRLRGLGAFASVELEPVGLWMEEPETWAVVAVQEPPARSADVVGAYTTDAGLLLGGDFRDRNLFGRAMHLDLRLRLGDAFGRLHPSLRIGRADRLDASLRAPRPFGAPFDAEASAFFRFEDQPSFLEERLGGMFGISRQLLSREDCRFCPDIVGQAGYELTAGRFELRTEESEEPDAPREPRAILEGPLANIGRVAAVLMLDRRDSFVDPRRGWAVDTRLELAQRWLSPLAEGHNFWRSLNSARGYLDLGTPWERPIGGERFLGGPVILAATAGFGAALPVGPEPGLPDSEALYYGGDYSVRGLAPFASAVAFPGANYKLDGSFELRWYVARNIFLGSIQIAGFTDFASVSYELSDLLTEPAVSAGPVIRYVTAVGPLSLGWGFPLVRPEPIVEVRPDLIPESGRLHLTFGYSF